MAEHSVKQGAGVPICTESVQRTDDSHKSQAKHRIQPTINPQSAEPQEQLCEGAEGCSAARPRATGCAIQKVANKMPSHPTAPLSHMLQSLKLGYAGLLTCVLAKLKNKFLVWLQAKSKGLIRAQHVV